MATRADEPLIVRGGGLEGDDARKAEQIRMEIAQTRNNMAHTAQAIEERLSPKHIKEQVSSVKNHVLEEFSSAKNHMLGELSGAKTRMLGEFKDAKEQIKGEVTSELLSAKQKVRQATVGRVENMVHDARETFTEAGSTTVDTIKTNPIPAALVAVGLGWLIAQGVRSKSTTDRRIQARSPRSRDQWYGYREGGPYVGIDEDGYRYTYRHEPMGVEGSSSIGGPRRMVRKGQRAVQNAMHSAEGAMHSAGASISNAANNVASTVKNGASGAVDSAYQTLNEVTDRVEHLAHDAGQTMGSYAQNAKMTTRRVVRRAGMQARRAEQTFETQLRENPLAFGAVAVAIGAAVGLLLPHTQVEDRMIGSTKDKLLQQAKTAATGAAEQALGVVQDKASELTSSISGQADGQSSSKSESKPYANGLSNGLSNGHSKHV